MSTANPTPPAAPRPCECGHEVTANGFGMDREKSTARTTDPKESSMGDESGYGVRECRGHWHVTHGGEDIVLPGDPFASEAEAVEAMYAAKDIAAMRYASAQSFLAFEASLPGNGLHCPTCGGRTNATDSLARASALAVDPSRSTPETAVAVRPSPPEGPQE